MHTSKLGELNPRTFWTGVNKIKEYYERIITQLSAFAGAYKQAILKFLCVKHWAVYLRIMIPMGCSLKVYTPIQFGDVCKTHPVAFSRDFATSAGCVGIDRVICCYMKDLQLLLALVQIRLHSISQTHLSCAFSLHGRWAKHKVLIHRDMHNWIYP